MILRSLSVLACAFVLALASCTSTNLPGPGGQIVKVKYYRLDAIAKVPPGIDPSLAFERNYHLRGAVSNEERIARNGHYYAVMWKVTDPTQPVKVRMEYRQQNTGTAVKMMEQEVAQIDRRNNTHFEVNGEQFVKDGAVTSWRASLVRGKQVLAEAKSYLWD